MNLQNPLKQPVTRDTTPNDSREILRRLTFAVYYLSLGGTFVFGLLALIHRDPDRLRVAGACALAFGVLWATRRLWAAPASAAAKVVPPVLASAPTPSAVSVPAPAADWSRPRVLLLNASLAGEAGNSARLLAALARHLAPQADLAQATLAGPGAVDFAALEPRLHAADAFVIATGTHWDSWSSPLQKFLEDATPAEASALWLGKPVAVLVTEHSVGGKGVLSRLQGVLVTLGCTLPPLSGLVLSRAAQLARAGASGAGAAASPKVADTAEAAKDFWSPEDLEVVAHNLLAAARQPRAEWKTWPVDRADFARTWLET